MGKKKKIKNTVQKARGDFITLENVWKSTDHVKLNLTEVKTKFKRNGKTNKN